MDDNPKSDADEKRFRFGFGVLFGAFWGWWGIGPIAFAHRVLSGLIIVGAAMVGGYLMERYGGRKL